jgi:hypothetical protein
MKGDRPDEKNSFYFINRLIKKIPSQEGIFL